MCKLKIAEKSDLRRVVSYVSKYEAIYFSKEASLETPGLWIPISTQLHAVLFQ